MKLAVFNPVLYEMELEDALKYLKGLGVDAMELGCGGYPGTRHANAIELDKNPEKLKRLKDLFQKYSIQIAALSVHGNGIHPNKEFAARSSADFEAACSVANKLGVDRIVTFSGCAGDGKGDYPNWITCTWPNEFSELLQIQWEQYLIPYWKRQAKIARDAGVKVAIEMHPGFMVYNPSTMMRLREAAGSEIGANFDPSHLIWQGVDPVQAIKYLGEAIYFFHAKDTMLNESQVKIDGVLDTKSYSNLAERSWVFRTVGYGRGDFRGMISMLKIVGYDHAISIEHEDSLMSSKEGLEKAIKTLKDIIIFDSTKGGEWWI